MAESSTLARPYAKAAFDFAHTTESVAEWEDFLFVVSTLVNDESYKSLLGNPSVSGQHKVSILIDVYNDQVATDKSTSFKSLLDSMNMSREASNAIQTGERAKAGESLQNFLQQLADNERLKLLPNIYQQFRVLRAKSLKQIEAEITTAYPLDATQKTLIKTRLEQSLNAKVVLQEVVDEKLIAGARIKIGDKVVDDSVAGKLKQLRTQLTSAYL